VKRKFAQGPVMSRSSVSTARVEILVLLRHEAVSAQNIGDERLLLVRGHRRFSLSA